MAANLQKVQDVVAKYNLGTLDNMISIDVRNEQPEISFHCYDTDRETVLVTLGDLLGRQWWERKLQYGNEAYRWIRVIDGVKFNIFDAEKIAKPVERPVTVTDFPIQLAEEAVV